MNLQDIFNRVLVLSGQFILPTGANEINIETGRFKTLVDIVLGTYNKYRPSEAILWKDMSVGRQYTFTDQNTPEGVPDMIVDIQPIRVAGVIPYYFQQGLKQIKDDYMQVKTPFPYTYRKPTITVPLSAEYEFHAVYYHKLVNLGTDVTPDWEVTTITDRDDLFFKLLTAKFITGVGYSRRAFTIEELSIKTDSASMVTEGIEMEKVVLADLAANIKFHLAWGG